MVLQFPGRARSQVNIVEGGTIEAFLCSDKVHGVGSMQVCTIVKELGQTLLTLDQPFNAVTSTEMIVNAYSKVVGQPTRKMEMRMFQVSWSWLNFRGEATNRGTLIQALGLFIPRAPRRRPPADCPYSVDEPLAIDDAASGEVGDAAAATAESLEKGFGRYSGDVWRGQRRRAEWYG